MRRAIIAALTALLVAIAAPVTPALAASSAKVVIIVGPVGSSNAHYKSDADALATAARKYTANVVKIYTPNATWSRVKAAVQGANVLVYLGHGNGWPSIYPPFQTVTKDGLGLDPTTGADGIKHVYYGEDYLRNYIRLAPNAVVLLYHLCYASGNTEPGLSQGTFTEARQRVDNYGAGFIGAGARAVFAEGHPDPYVTSYIRQLFTTNRTMDQVFRSAPTWHGHLQGPFAAQRTPGLRFEMDPDKSTPSGFYRSVVGDLSLTASAVVGPTLAPTGTNPPDFVVPGAAEVMDASGAGLFATGEAAADPTAVAPGTLTAATHLRLTAEAAPAADGTRIFAATILGTTTSGFVRATGLAPRDSAATVAWSLDQSGPLLSPNADNASDGLVVAARFSESVAASFVVRNAAGTIVKSLSVTNDIARFSWDLTDASGAVVPDGSYSWSFRARDAWGNTGVTGSGTFTLDDTPPVSRATSTSTAGLNGWSVSPVTVSLTAKDALSGVRSLYWRLGSGAVKTYSGAASVAANGTPTFQYRAIDKAGIKESWHSLTLRIDTVPPVIAVALAGTAGDAQGTWRGPVSVTPTFTDATSGVAGGLVSVDGSPAAPFAATPLVVDGDGTHTLTFTATDLAGNQSSRTTTFLIDTLAPTVSLPAAAADAPVGTVTPNGDGRADTIAVPFAVSENATVTAVITGPDGAVVRTLGTTVPAGDGRLAWDGRTASGTAVPDGRYTATLTGRDPAGNVGPPVAATVDVYAALSALARTPAAFFPQDADALATKTTATFRLVSAAQVTVRVVDAAGNVVRTAYADRAMAAGTASWAWNGKRTDGTWAPRGTYRIVVSATNGVQAATQSVTVLADAFRLTTSVTTAVRGKAFTITARTTEGLSTTPTVTIREPGLTAWTITMTKASSTTWTAKVTPRTSGAAGTLSLTVKARDTAGGLNWSVVKLALQ